MLSEIGDGGEILHRLLPPPNDRSFVCLRFVDWYGDTSFNHLQMPDLISELDRLKTTPTDVEAEQLLDDIRTLATRCLAERHTYLKFYGD
jgi:hypothetical protein